MYIVVNKGPNYSCRLMCNSRMVMTSIVLNYVDVTSNSRMVMTSIVLNYVDVTSNIRMVMTSIVLNYVDVTSNIIRIRRDKMKKNCHS